MPVLTISDIVLGEIGQMKFRYGGTPADVVEYPDGGRMASGQAVSVEGLHAVSDTWASYDPSIVPTADGNGVIPEFYGPEGVLALRVDFGFGPVILRADAANLHKELRDILIARLAQLQVDEENFRGVVSAEIDAIRTTVDTVVSDTLAQVEDIISEQQEQVIQDKVEQVLDTSLAPIVDSRIDAAMQDRVPPLIDAAVPPVVQAEVATQIGTVTNQLELTQSQLNQLAIDLANTRYTVDGNKAQITSLSNRVTATETLLGISQWSRTVTFTDCTLVARFLKFRNIVIGYLEATARTTNGGQTGYLVRTGLGLPAAYMPPSGGIAVAAPALAANGTLIDPENFRIGLNSEGEFATQGYENWHVLRGTLVYFT